MRTSTQVIVFGAYTKAPYPFCTRKGLSLLIIFLGGTVLCDQTGEENSETCTLGESMGGIAGLKHGKISGNPPSSN